MNLHFVTSNQKSTRRKLDFPLTSSIYLVALPLEMHRRLKQTNVYYILFRFFALSERKRPTNLDK